MARFRVNKLYRIESIILGHEIYTPIWWKPWNKKVFTRTAEEMLMGHAVLICGGVFIRELRGRLVDSSYEFECEAPRGFPKVFSFNGTVCEVERMD